MKLRSGESVTIDILGSARELFWGVVAQVFWFMAFVIVAALAPVVLFVLPAILILRNPSGDYSLMGCVFFFAAPWSCAFFMAISVHWHSARQWRREGRDSGVMGSNWREAHGGMFSTLLKSTVYMFAALFASYILGFSYLYAWSYVPLPQPAKLLVGFELFPFAAYAPVILLWVWRWQRGRRDHLRARGIEYDAA